MTDRLNKTSICSIVFLDIVDYSKKSVSEQFDDKALFNELINEAIKNVAQNDRVILDTGDGAAITLMGEPEEALFVALTIRDGILAHNKTAELTLLVRIGINLGSVRVVRDINDHLNIIGDGINVAQRIMSFAGENQILVSRSYYEVTSRLTKEITGMFVYSGIKQDKHVREHEVYSIKPNPTHQTLDEYDAIEPAKNGAPLSATLTANLKATLENSVDKAKTLMRSAAQCTVAWADTFKKRLQSIQWNALTLGLVAATVLLLLIFVWLLIKPTNDAATSVAAPKTNVQNTDSMNGEKASTIEKSTAEKPAVVKPMVEPKSTPTNVEVKQAAEREAAVKAVVPAEKPIAKPIEKPVKKAKSKAKSNAVKEEPPKVHEPVAASVQQPACSQAEIAMSQCRR